MASVLDNRSRAGIAVIALAMSCLVAIATGLFSILLLIAVAGGDRDHVVTTGALLVWLARGQMICMVFSAAVFMRWMYRAYGNALALGERSFWSQGWAIGAWFVPPLNLVVPFQIVAAIRRNAARLTGKHVSRPIAMTWWLTWVVAKLGGWSIMLSGLARHPGTVTLALAAVSLLNAIEVVSGCCAIVMVRRLTSLQQEASSLDVARTFDGDVPDPPPAPVAVRRQVVGSQCDDCRRPIDAILDTVACRTCTGAFHRRCAPTAICVKCGGDDLVRGVATI